MDNPFSIPREAWKLMTRLCKFVNARRKAERSKREPKPDSIPRVNSNQPSILHKKQYDALPTDIKAPLVEQVVIDVCNIEEESPDDSSAESYSGETRNAMSVLTDTDRHVLQTLQSLYNPD